MSRFTLAATATFGMESVVSAELAALGYAGMRAENGRVLFEGTGEDVALCNIRLRAADRLLLRLSEFPAAGYDELFEGVRGIQWKDFLPANVRLVVTARLARGRDPLEKPPLGVPGMQSVGKKAIMEALLGGKTGRVEETGPLLTVDIAVSAGKAAVTIDTSGSGLHKRGYRTEAGEAPLRETLAAGMMLLSRWDPSRPLVDPLCGSGTIAIEAALIAANIAPGKTRSFAAEECGLVPASVWRLAREKAVSEERRGVEASILASDKDARVLEMARRNSGRAGTGSLVAFKHMALESLSVAGEFGCIITNPPYAERLGENRAVESLYRTMGALYRRLPTWSLFALSAHPAFPKLFGVRATKNRKLYNGDIRCYFYQYFGPLPPRDQG